MKNRINHLLIEKAFLFSDHKESIDPEGCRYDFLNGGWMKNEGGEEVFLVRSTDPNKPMAGTKKADLETGEDQKGE